MKIALLMVTSALVVLCCEVGFAQEFREPTFETTGDFGDPMNWSDPEAAPPENPPGAPFAEWGFTVHHINDNQTATISFDSEHGSHFQTHNLYVGDSPVGVLPTPGTLILNGGPAPAPGEFGASLSVPSSNALRMGRVCTLDGSLACTGGGTIILNGASEIFANGIIVGERADGEMFIGPNARVRSGRLIEGGLLQREDMRIGSYGPERGVNGNGLVQVEGELIANTIYMPESDAVGVLRVMPGGIVDTKGIDLAFEAFRPNRSSTLEIVGSGGSFTTTVGSLLASHPTATIKFTADAAGVTPIVSVGISGPEPSPPGGADVDGGNLVLDLDAFNFNSSSTMMLIDVAPDSLFGPFGTVTFLGDTTADVNYDYANGDIFLSNFVSTKPPGVDGDYNNDGTVDAADYVVWRKHNGSTTVLPNDTTPGFVSPADYDVWRQNFGATSGESSGLTAVPEPGSLAAALLLMACCAATRRSRRKRDSA